MNKVIVEMLYKEGLLKEEIVSEYNEYCLKYSGDYQQDIVQFILSNGYSYNLVVDAVENKHAFPAEESLMAYDNYISENVDEYMSFYDFTIVTNSFYTIMSSYVECSFSSEFVEEYKEVKKDLNAILAKNQLNYSFYMEQTDSYVYTDIMLEYLSQSLNRSISISKERNAEMEHLVDFLNFKNLQKLNISYELVNNDLFDDSEIARSIIAILDLEDLTAIDPLISALGLIHIIEIGHDI